jgi:hypothetical protein
MRTGFTACGMGDDTALEDYRNFFPFEFATEAIADVYYMDMDIEELFKLFWRVRALRITMTNIDNAILFDLPTTRIERVIGSDPDSGNYLPADDEFAVCTQAQLNGEPRFALEAVNAPLDPAGVLTAAIDFRFEDCMYDEETRRFLVPLNWRINDVDSSVFAQSVASGASSITSTVLGRSVPVDGGSTGDVTIEIAEYWPYADPLDAAPVWDSSSGSRLVMFIPTNLSTQTLEEIEEELG